MRALEIRDVINHEKVNGEGMIGSAVRNDSAYTVGGVKGAARGNHMWRMTKASRD
jgi:hypothetical protein